MKEVLCLALEVDAALWTSNSGCEYPLAAPSTPHGVLVAELAIRFKAEWLVIHESLRRLNIVQEWSASPIGCKIAAERAARHLTSLDLQQVVRRFSCDYPWSIGYFRLALIGASRSNPAISGLARRRLPWKKVIRRGRLPGLLRRRRWAPGDRKSRRRRWRPRGGHRLRPAPLQNANGDGRNRCVRAVR